jgi:iron complex outermembrane receptor protein
VAWPAEGLLLTGDGSQDTEAWAVFAEGSYNITDKTRLTLGARYSDEEKDFDLRPIGVPEEGRVKENDSWDDVTYRVGIDQVLSDDVMVYFTYATGFKSGGFNEQATSPATAALSFDPEEADSYEIGMKSDLLDNSLRLNLAAFYVEYTDLQLDSVIPVEGSEIGQESVITNAGEVTSWGIEMDMLWLVTERLTIDATLGYLDSEYDKFDCDLDRDPTNGNEDCSVLDVKRTPEVTASLGATYSLPLGGLGGMELNANATYTDEFYNDIFNSEASIHEDVTLLNASISYITEDEKIRLSLFGRNLTDEEYQTSGLGVANLWSFSVYGAPMTYGVEAELRF